MDIPEHHHRGKQNGIVFIEDRKLMVDGEHYLPNHCFSYIMSGTLAISAGIESKTFKKGEFAFGAGKRLARIRKNPDPEGLFKAIVVVMDDELLQNFCRENQVLERKNRIENPVFSLKPSILLKNYFDSLLPYFEMDLPETLVSLKKKEGIMLFITEYPELADILFDFSAPGKIDLEKYMNQNFRYNTQINRYAYLTGRSIATFKRDFQKIFKTSPNRWLQQKRLEEAYYLIKEKGQKPSDVFLEVGFETLAHFSYSFKRFFGVNPSSIK